MKTQILGAAVAALAFSTSTMAAPPSAPSVCALSQISPAASACSGFYAGNLLNNSKVAAQQTGLAAIGFTWDGNFANVTKIDSLNGGTNVNWSSANQNPLTTMYGTTFVGLHFGNGAGLGGQVTGFFKFDAGTAGLQSFALNILQGSSGAVLYSTGSAPPIGGSSGGGSSSSNSGGVGAVPEPASWVMLIAGFGLVGTTRRRRRSAAETVAA